jgi:hypothetical protein
VEEIRRDDGELCGFVVDVSGRWAALAVFGSTLAEYDSEEAARHHVAERGLAALADRWTLIDGASGAEQVVCIQQANPVEVSVALGYYSLPGVESLAISSDEITSGRWRLEHRA